MLAPYSALGGPCLVGCGMIPTVPASFKVVLTTLALLCGGEHISRPETFCLAKAVYFEVRDQDIESQVAIASFVYQFAQRNNTTICAEIYDTPVARYPWVVRDKINMKSPPEREAWERAVKISAWTLKGTLRQNVGDATHFLTPSIIKRLPKWYDPNKVVYKVGLMEFLKLNDFQ